MRCSAARARALFLYLPFFLLFFLFLQAANAQGEFYDYDFYDDDYFFEFTGVSGITIVATRQTSQQMDVIEREEIEQRGAKDLASLLQETLSLNIVRYGGHGNQTNIHMRGYSSRRVAFLIDGIPANSAIDGGFDINQIDLSSIERIEVIYGGSDTKFNVSGAMGGVINIITVRRQEPGWRFRSSISNTSSIPGEYIDRLGVRQSPHWGDLFDAQNITLSAAYGAERFSFRGGLFANRAGNHFLFRDFVNIRRRMDNNEVWDAGVNASFVWDLGSFSRLIATSNFFYADRNLPTSGFSDLFGVQESFNSRQTLMLEMPRAFHDDFATEVSLSWNFGRMDYTTPAGALSRHYQNSISLINRWAWYSGERLTLRSGYDYRFIHLDSTEMGTPSRHDGGVYITAEFRPQRQFQIIPSVKAVFTSHTPETRESQNMTLVPKLGLLWNVTDSLLLRNNYFRSFKFPEFQDLYWGINSNPDLYPEDGFGADIGAVWNLNRHLTLESTFFSQWMRNSIHWSTEGAGVWRPENVGQALFFGLNNSIGFNKPVSIGPVRQITASLSYNYLRSYLLSFGHTFASNKRIPYNPEHTIGGSLRFYWGSGSLLISGHYEGVRFEDRANLNALDPYFLLNAAVNQRITGNITAFGSLRNILNTSYELFYRYPMPGTSLTLGMRMEF